MNNNIKSLGDIFDFNSLTISLALGDLSNDDAMRCARDGAGSSIAFLAGHLLSSRYGILKMLGAADENPYAEQYGQNAEPNDDHNLEKMKADWGTTSALLTAALENATEDQILADAPGGFPVPDKTIRGGLMFLAWHETYHVGQVGLMRTEYGYPSVQEQIHEHLTM